MTSSWKMRSLSASDRWHARRVVAVRGEQLGDLRSAHVEHVGAARMERAARRHEDQRGRQPLDRHQPLLGVAVVQPRDRLQEPPRVRVVRAVVDVATVAGLHDLAGVHHLDVVAVFGHHAEVVRDDDDGGVELLLQPVDAGRGSGPGPSRRAPWWARRRSAGPGSATSAMAIIARWRMPPENSCGYWSARSSGRGMPDPAEHLDGLLVRLLLRDLLVDADRPRRSGRRPCRRGAATSSGPGRSSRSSRRGSCASRRGGASAGPGPGR